MSLGEPIALDGESLTVSALNSIANGARVVIPSATLQIVAGQRAKLERLLCDNTPVYGLNTGVGQLVHFALESPHLRDFQRNLVRSHSVGSGPCFTPRESRAILASRANTLAKGCSAVRPELVCRLASFLNANITPVIPQTGSLGASGDLAPLAHLALAIIGEGMSHSDDGKPVPTAELLALRQMDAFELDTKEGLSLINGCSAMTAVGSLVVADAWTQVRQAEAIGALGLQVLRASLAPFERCGHDVRPHLGQMASAANVRLLLSESKLMAEHADLSKALIDARPIQDPILGTGIYLQKAYSLRAVPQILGAVRGALAHVESVLEVELNSAGDNPLIVGDELFHGANFHGQVVAGPLDYLMLSLLQVGILSERRLNRLVHPALNGELPPFLVADRVGLSCGFAGAQYLATSLVAECRTIGAASTQSIPSNGDNQDVVSMGLIAARNSRRVCEANSTVLAVEALAAAQAVDLLDVADALSPATAAVYRTIRRVSAPLHVDRSLAEDIVRLAEAVRGGEILSDVESSIGVALP